MFELENEYLKIRVNEDGGSLTSVYDKVNKNELLYQLDDRSWHGQDVVIFPFIAKLKNGSYMVDGKDYYMKNHGLVRYNKVSLNKKSDNTLSLFFESNSETLKEYPYKFHLEIKYILDGHKLSIRYKITNTDDKPIYYEFGGHPALKTSGIESVDGFEYEDTKIEFDTSLEVNKYYLDETGSYIIGKNINKIPREMYVKKKMISDSKTLIFDAKEINNVILTTNGYSYKFDINEAEILAFWCDPHFGDYICVEPWWGIPDIINPNPELKDKPLMHSLNPKESEEKGYTIVISKNI
ncbi:MAG: hypothetical protein IKP77_06385 [Acholeplasmatales bacterium]|nr:hypothetical protein [Acholeplasmatales bacterium]